MHKRGSVLDIVPRIREVFCRFDTSGDGALDVYELRKVLHTLLGRLTYRECEKVCREIDLDSNGHVCMKEFVEWALHGPVSEQICGAVKHETGEIRSKRIRDAFDRYDSSGDGSLDIAELQIVLKSLGAFTNNEVVIVCKDLDKNNDMEVSFEEFESWLKHGAGGGMHGVIHKAKSILAPSDDDGLEAVFYCYCTAGRCDMESSTFLKICKAAGGILDKKLTPTDLDLIFDHKSVKPPGSKFIDFCQFEVALEIIAERKGLDLHDLHETFVILGNPVLKGTRAEYVRFHDDKSTYTGSHRFDKANLPGGGSTAKFIAEVPHTHEFDDKPPTALSSMARSSSGFHRHNQRKETRILKTRCTSLDDPVANNRELYKVFGLGTKAGRLIRNAYSQEEMKEQRSPREAPLSPALRERREVRAASSAGRAHKSASLPTLRPAPDKNKYVGNKMWSLRRGQFTHKPQSSEDILNHFKDRGPVVVSSKPERLTGTSFFPRRPSERDLPQLVAGPRLVSGANGSAEVWPQAVRQSSSNEGSGESSFTLTQSAESRVAASAGGQRSKPSFSPLLHTADLARAGFTLPCPPESRATASGGGQLPVGELQGFTLPQTAESRITASAVGQRRKGSTCAGLPEIPRAGTPSLPKLAIGAMLGSR